MKYLAEVPSRGWEQLEKFVVYLGDNPIDGDVYVPRSDTHCEKCRNTSWLTLNHRCLPPIYFVQVRLRPGTSQIVPHIFHILYQKKDTQSSGT